MKFLSFLRRQWWKILIGVLAGMIVGAGVFAAVKVRPAAEFVERNFAAETTSGVEITAEPFVAYISAIDEGDGSLPETARSDLNILLAVNPVEKRMLMVNIPRDGYVEIPGYAARDKLTHAGSLGGMATSKATIENLLGIEINYTFRVNFQALSGVVDAIGGITIESGAATFTTVHDSGCVILTGANELDGRCAVAYARERIAVGGDLKRAENEEKVIDAIFQKIRSDKGILWNYETILKALDGTFETNLSAGEVYQIVTREISGDWTVERANIGVTGAGEEYTPSFPNEKKFVYYLDEGSVTEVRWRILEVLRR